MAQWFGAQDERVKQLGGKQSQGMRTEGADKTQTPSAVSNPEFWKQSVYPETNQHAEESFGKELRPWAEKLAKAGIRLSDEPRSKRWLRSS